MATEKTANYSDAALIELRDLYNNLGNDGLEHIARSLNKSVRSVRSKLVREGIYVSTPKTKAPATSSGPSKKELLNDLEAIVGFDVSGFAGATKPALQALIDRFSA